MEFTLNVNPDTQAIAFIDQVMENYTELYNLPYKRELRFVVHELVINAVEAMGKIDTPSQKEIQILVTQSYEEIKITVTDEAKGIAENDWDKVLQFDLDELDYSDRGRGLFFVKNMVDHIWFENISETKFLVGISKRFIYKVNVKLGACFNEVIYTKKMNLLIFGCIILLTSLLAGVNFFVAKNNLLESADTKLLSDIQVSYEYLDAKYPGEWSIKNNQLYKGDINMVENFEAADKVGELTNGNAVSIFQNDTRISTNIVDNGQRALNTKVSDEVATVVLGEKSALSVLPMS